MPILYSFRRCPYAMRARLAIAASRLAVELREVVLRDKPADMLAASPKGTVPVLVLPQGEPRIVEESLDIMRWALAAGDPEGWMAYPPEALAEMDRLIETLDGPFKTALDRYKYSTRHDDADRAGERERAATFIRSLEALLAGRSYLFGDRFSFADGAVLPFVRQYAFTDIAWFRGQDWPGVTGWLDAFLASERFAAVMAKYPQWRPGTPGARFGGSENRDYASLV
ncbi:MAG: glutathione S-transferase [Nitratireductor sp.]|nr:glutathione S-transferase [Nitratireductor sp.]